MEGSRTLKLGTEWGYKIVGGKFDGHVYLAYSREAAHSTMEEWIFCGESRRDAHLVCRPCSGWYPLPVRQEVTDQAPGMTIQWGVRNHAFRAVRPYHSEAAADRLVASLQHLEGGSPLSVVWRLVGKNWKKET